MREQPSVLKRKFIILDLIVFALSLFLDQWSKQMIRTHLKEQEYFELIPGILQIYHHENAGASWGMLKGQTVLFLLIAAVASICILYLISRIPAAKKYAALHICLSLILSGAIGNTIDRAMKATVTDFIYAVVINFPIFNVADICIVTATICLLVLVLFVYKEKDLDFLKRETKQKGTENRGGEQN